MIKMNSTTTEKDKLFGEIWWKNFHAIIAASYQEEFKNAKVWPEIKDYISTAASIISNKDLAKREKILSFITTNEYGMAHLVKGLEVTLLTPCSEKLSKILRECLNPRNNTYRQAALRQLDEFNTIGITIKLLGDLERVIKENLVDEDLMGKLKKTLVNVIWFFSAVATKDPKFPSKIRSMSKIKFMHCLIKKNISKDTSTTHYPLLKIFRILSKNPKVASCLGRDKIMETIQKIFSILPIIPSPKFGILFEILIQLTKERANCRRLIKANVLNSLSRIFNHWQLFKGKGLLKLTKNILTIYSNLSYTNCGKKALKQSEKLNDLRKFCEFCPNDKHFDIIIMRILSLVSFCYSSHKLPFKSLMNPVKFSLPKISEFDVKLNKDSGTSSDDEPDDETISESSDSDAEVEIELEPKSSCENLTELDDNDNDINDDEDDDYDDDHDVSGDSYKNDQDEMTSSIDEKSTTSSRRKDLSEDEELCLGSGDKHLRPLLIQNLEKGGPVLLSELIPPTVPCNKEAEAILEYSKYFKEFSQNESGAEGEGQSSAELIEASIILRLLYGPKFEFNLDGITFPSKYRQQQHAVDSENEQISNDEIRKIYIAIANSITHVMPFVKIAYPDLVLAYSSKKLEPLTTYLERTNMRKKIVENMTRIVGEDPFKPKIVYDLDALISTRKSIDKKSKILDDSTKPLGNDDEREVGKVDRRNSLKFESRFECGNLRKAIQVGQFEYDLYLTSDINSNAHNQWFYFQVSNVNEDVPYVFNIVNCIKGNSQFNFGMQPVVFSVIDYANGGKAGWARSGSNLCYFKNGIKNYTGKKFKAYYTASFTLTFQRKGDICYIAYHFPYTYTRLLTELWKLLKIKNLDNNNQHQLLARYDVLCKTLNNNEVPLITITAKQDEQDPIENRNVIFISGRVHPGESNSSWVMHGILHKLLLGSESIMETILKKYIFKIVPMLNIEGVLNGCHRTGLSNQDLNRQWSHPNGVMHPSIYNSKALIEYSCNILHKVPVLYCDLHGHSRKKNVFFYGCSVTKSWSPADRCKPENPNSIMGLPEAMARRSNVFELSHCNFDVKKSRESTARVALWREFGITRSYTLEASYCGCDRGPYEGLSIGTYQLLEVGEKLCEAIEEIHNPVVVQSSGDTDIIYSDSNSDSQSEGTKICNPALERESQISIESYGDSSSSEFESDEIEEWSKEEILIVAQ